MVAKSQCPDPSSYLGLVQIHVAFAETPTQTFCDSGYVVGLDRADGKPISDHEVEVLLRQLLKGFEGESLFIDRVAITPPGSR